MLWLLDDGPLGLLGRHFDATWSWPASTLHVVREVAMGSPRDKTGRRQMLLDMKDAAGTPSILVHDGDARSAAILFGHFRQNSALSTSDLGEDASIAFCLAELPAGVFVTIDKRAAYVALAELGPERVATPFDVWLWLRDQAMITQEQCQALGEATARQDQGLSRIPYRFGPKSLSQE